MDNIMTRHNCEDWRNEGTGCSICSQITKNYTTKELKETLEYVNARINELTQQRDEAFKLLVRTKDCFDYLDRMHPEITGGAVRGSLWANIDKLLNQVSEEKEEA